MFFNILPSAWRLAFGEAEVPEGLKDKGDDYHTNVKSKVRRVSVWFQMPETDVQNIVFSRINAGRAFDDAVASIGRCWGHVA